MAIVKLDMTEYNLLLENKKLLKESLVREKELSGQIDSLNQEKIKILEESENMVTIVERTEHVGKIYHKRNVRPSDFYRVGSSIIVEEISDCLNILTTRYNYEVVRKGLIEWAESTFITSNTVNESEKTVTRKGFDEVKKEVREEYLADLDEETKRKLKRGEEAQKNVQKLTAQLDMADEIKNMAVESLEKRIKQLEAFWDIHIKDLHLEIDEPVSIFNYGSYKKNLKLLAEETKETYKKMKES